MSWARGLLDRDYLSGGGIKGTPTHFRIKKGHKVGLSDHIPRLRHCAWGWGLDPGSWGRSTGKDKVAPKSDEVVETPQAQFDKHNVEFGGGVPKALYAGQTVGWTLPAAIHRQKIPDHHLRSALGPVGTTPHPQVFSVACGAPAPGDRSAAGDAQPGLPAFASSPSPSPSRAAQDAASEQRPRRSGPRPDRAPGQASQGGGDAPGLSDPTRPSA
jgi:hypothetical protein